MYKRQGQFLGFLRVQTDVPGANVYVDEREAGALGRTPFQNPVKVGKHHLWIEKPGYQVIERDIDVGVGEDPLVKLELERVDYGRIRVVASHPEAEVYIDGKRIGRVPIETDVDTGTKAPTDIRIPQADANRLLRGFVRFVADIDAGSTLELVWQRGHDELWVDAGSITLKCAPGILSTQLSVCLLYTSDAADD